MHVPSIFCDTSAVRAEAEQACSRSLERLTVESEQLSSYVFPSEPQTASSFLCPPGGEGHKGQGWGSQTDVGIQSILPRGDRQRTSIDIVILEQIHVIFLWSDTVTAVPLDLSEVLRNLQHQHYSIGPG